MNAEIKKTTITDFFRKEHKKLEKYVQRKINDTAQQDSNDIIQDVMLNIFDKADVSFPLENFSSYVYQSLKNRIIDIFKKKDNPVNNSISLDKKIKDDSKLVLSDVLYDIRYDTVSEIEKNEIKIKLYSVIDSMDDNYKAIIIATEFEGKSFKILSEEWNVSIGTLLSRKSRALKKIQSELIDFIKTP